MKLRAQNTIEIITMVSIVVVVVLSAFMFMHGSDNKMVALSGISKTNFSNTAYIDKEKSTNIKTNNTIDSETAGALSSRVANMNNSELLDKLSNKTINEIMNIKTTEGKDIFDLANELIKEYQGQITVSPFEEKELLNNENKKDLVTVKIETKRILDITKKTDLVYEQYITLLDIVISQ